MLAIPSSPCCFLASPSCLLASPSCFFACLSCLLASLISFLTCPSSCLACPSCLLACPSRPSDPPPPPPPPPRVVCRSALIVVFVEDAELLSDPAALGDDLVLHEGEAHGQDGHAEHDVDGAQEQLGLSLRVLEVGAGHDVAEADGGERDEAEVGGLQPVPAFPQPEQHRAAEDVAADDDHGDGQRHRDLFLVQVVVVIVIAVVV